MEQRVCWICGAGDFTPRLFVPAAGDMVVAADGGLAYLARAGVVPDHILGDFDSLGRRPDGANVTAYPPEKDDTDMLLAVKYGLARGCRRFYLYGGLGGRLSHTLANLQVLRFLARQGACGILVDSESVVTVFARGRLRFAPGCGGVLSVFACGGAAEGVSIRGMKYNVERVSLSPDYPLGTSNEFTGASGEIEVETGTLAVVWEHETSDFRQMTFEPADGV